MAPWIFFISSFPNPIFTDYPANPSVIRKSLIHKKYP